LNLIWAKTMKTVDESTLLAVISPNQGTLGDEKGFISIKEDAIKLILKQSVYSHQRWIPSQIELHINETGFVQANPVRARLLFDLIDFQHNRIFTAHYWRYHMKISGTISVGMKTESFINSPQIMELLIFKRQKMPLQKIK
jgi:hypothetical protein